MAAVAYAEHGQSLIDYRPYRLGDSRLLFRGPQQERSGKHVAYLGGTETYGRFLENPFPDLIAERTGLPAVNLGCVNAGVDVYLGQDEVLKVCRTACATVVEILGAQNLSNGYYCVHPRRNDRFVKPSAALKALYPEVDFAEINFTRHLLTTLLSVSRRRFAQVRNELRRAWVARMERLLTAIGGPVILLWFSDRAVAWHAEGKSLGSDPLFVTRAMLDRLEAPGVRLVELVPDRPMIKAGVGGMLFSGLEAAAAHGQLGHVAHLEAARQLSAMLREHAGKEHA